MSLFIAVEGPIGVGKSSLATQLAATLNMTPLYEIVEENPFLSDFYEDISKWSFQTEMFFLCNRYKQLGDSADQSIVSDYHIMKNKIFARNTLNDKEFEMFTKIYDVMTEDIRMPDLTIFLTAELPVLKERIKMRNRDFEASISDDYLETLTRDYYSIYKASPDSLYIDTTHIDFVHNDKDYQQIVEQIKQRIGEQYV